MRSSIYMFIFLLAIPGQSLIAQMSAELDFRLVLGNEAFDPVDQSPTIPPGWQQMPHQGKDLFLVQFNGPIQRSWLEDLADRDLQVVQYLYPFTYIVWGQESQTRSLDYPARWTGAFHPAWRVQPRWRTAGPDPVLVNLLVYRGASLDRVEGSLLALGAQNIRKAALDARFMAYTLMLAGTRFSDAAAIPGVYSLQPMPTDGGNRSEMSSQVNVNNIDGANLAFPGYRTWLNSVNLSGAGIILADVDSGTDETHPDLIQNIIACEGVSCGGATSSSHGTHTAGIIAGNGVSGTLDGFGFLRGLGVAPEASLVEQKYPGIYTQPGGMLLLMSESSRNGAILSSNSWGPASTPQGYDNQTMQVDIGTRDADPELPGNQPFNYILAIMNGNGGNQSQGTPDEAKNIFKVGSTWMRNANGSQNININSISDNSAHGPALDNRNLPDIVAPGKRVDSTIPNGSYGLMGGTSMACPQVAGGVGLFFEYYRNLPGCRPDPSPALVKAAFLPVARDLFGGLDADAQPLGHRFDSRQGWGRMDLAAVVAPDQEVVYLDNPTIFSQTGNAWTRSFTVADPSKPVKMMLAWTDAPGHGLGGTTPAWNNDLDLVVTYNGGTYRGNNLGANGWSASGGTADFRNNTEGVLLGPTASGSLSVRVQATNLNSDAIPGQGNSTDQDFAFVCYNCRVEPSFTFCADGDFQQVCGGAEISFGFNLTALDGFSTPVDLSVSGLPDGVTGTFDPNPIVPSGHVNLNLSDIPADASGTFGLVVKATSGSLSFTLPVTLQIVPSLTTAPVLLAPESGSVSSSMAPTLSWESQGENVAYLVQVSASPGFETNLYEVQTNETAFQVPQTLSPGQTFYWRLSGISSCGKGPTAAAWSFTTANLPTVLLVDDDDNNPDVRQMYADSLDQLGIDYQIWDTANSQSEPTAADMAPFLPVIWFSGVASDSTQPRNGPTESGEFELINYLEGGGSLILSAQEYMDDRFSAGLTPFMTDYLGLDSTTIRIGHSSVSGAGLLSGQGPFDLDPNFSGNSDLLVPNDQGQILFQGDLGSAGLYRIGPNYTTAWTGFELASLDAAPRKTVLGELLKAIAFSGLCTNLADLQERLPQWPETSSILDLIPCINEFQ